MTEKTTRSRGRPIRTVDPPAELAAPSTTAAPGGGLVAETERTVAEWAGALWPRTWTARAARTTPVIFVDEWTDTTGWTVEAELPGIDPDRDLTLLLDRHVLELRARRRATPAPPTSTVRRELRAGSLRRTMSVPRGADPAGATATYRDGVLTVRVPLVGRDGVDHRRPLPVVRD